MEKDKIIALLVILAVVLVSLNVYQYLARTQLDYNRSGASISPAPIPAPTGTYTAATGSTVVIGVVQKGGTTVILPKRTGSTAGLTVGMKIGRSRSMTEFNKIVTPLSLDR